MVAKKKTDSADKDSTVKERKPVESEPTKKEIEEVDASAPVETPPPNPSVEHSSTKDLMAWGINSHSLVMLRDALGCGPEPSDNKVVMDAARKLRKKG